MWNRGTDTKAFCVALLTAALLASCAPSTPAIPPTQPTPPTQLPAVTPTIQPSPASTNTPLPEKTFTSSRFAYSITLPATWSMEETPGQWDGKMVLGAANAGMDVFRRSASEDIPTMEIGFLPIAAGTTLESWAQTEGPRGMFSSGKLDPTMEPITVGGEPGLLQHQVCSICPRLTFFNVYFLHGSQGGLVLWAGSASSVSTLISILQSLKFP
jgi:hypothetical protein